MDVALFLLVDVAEDVVLRIAENLHCDGVMMVLQWRHVIVAKSQLRLCIYLIPTPITLHAFSAMTVSHCAI